MKFKITQIKSSIGYREKTKQTLVALGLTKMHQTIKKEANPAIIGMINKIKHLVKVEEIK